MYTNINPPNWCTKTAVNFNHGDLDLSTVIYHYFGDTLMLEGIYDKCGFIYRNNKLYYEGQWNNSYEPIGEGIYYLSDTLRMEDIWDHDHINRVMFHNDVQVFTGIFDTSNQTNNKFTLYDETGRIIAFNSSNDIDSEPICVKKYGLTCNIYTGYTIEYFKNHSYKTFYENGVQKAFGIYTDEQGYEHDTLAGKIIN
jgi:hypothetical protein